MKSSGDDGAEDEGDQADLRETDKVIIRVPEQHAIDAGKPSRRREVHDGGMTGEARTLRR